MERLSSALTRAVLYRWSVTQSATLEEQLRNGVRYLDVRVAIQEKGAPPLVVHHLCGAELGPLLAQLDAFLTAHPQEVVVVDFQHFYGFERLDHERLIAHLQGLFGARLCPYWPGATEEATLRWMQVRLKKLFFMDDTQIFFTKFCIKLMPREINSLIKIIYAYWYIL
jgi:hypothetical protein